MMRKSLERGVACAKLIESKQANEQPEKRKKEKVQPIYETEIQNFTLLFLRINLLRRHGFYISRCVEVSSLVKFDDRCVVDGWMR